MVAIPALLLLTLGTTGFRQAASPTSTAAASPCSFVAPFALIENLGQWPENIRFVGDLPGLRVRAECGAIALESGGGGAGVLVRLTFVGATDDALVEGVDRRPGVYNFFLGNDPAQWRHDVPSFSGVRYQNLYPGIDLVLRGGNEGFEYDLLVAPGADLGQLRLRCEGAGDLAPLDDGQIAAGTPLGAFLHVPGKSWQVLDSGEKRDVACTWVRLGTDSFGVETPTRDPNLPLVIDPSLLWSTYLGSSAGGLANCVAVDPTTGDVVVGGMTQGSNFPQTPGTFQAPHGTINQGYVTKFHGSDGTLLWSSVFGGTWTSGNQGPNAVAVDTSGRVTAGGATLAVDFPTTPGAFQTQKHSSPNGPSGFVTQFTPRGNALVYSTYVEGPVSGGDVFAAQGTPSGEVVIGGAAFGPDFPVTPGAFQTSANGSSDGFVARLNASGSRLIWSTFLGGSASEGVSTLVLDRFETITVAGTTASFNFPTTPGAFQATKAFQTLGVLFVSRLNSQGSQLIWSSYLGGTGQSEIDYVGGVGVDASGMVTVGGSTNAHTFPVTPGAFQTQFSASLTGYAGFLARFTIDGQALVFSTFLSGPSGGGIGQLAVDPSGIVTAVGGGYAGFPITPGAFDTTSSSGGKPAIVRFSPAGDRIFYSTFLGGTNSQSLFGLSMTPSGRVSAAGHCYSPGGYPTTTNAFQPNFPGGQTASVVTTFDLLLQGISQSGVSTPSCNGPLTMNATQMPVAGATHFSVYCSTAPPNANGLLLIGYPSSMLHRVGMPGMGQHQVYLRLPVRSDAAGFAETYLPLPANSAGTSFSCEYVFQNTPICQGSSAFSSSNTLDVTVQ